MKCPYRKNIIRESNIICNEGRHKNTDLEEFADCHKEECPFYDATSEYCKKVEAELGGTR